MKPDFPNIYIYETGKQKLKTRMKIRKYTILSLTEVRQISIFLDLDGSEKQTTMIFWHINSQVTYLTKYLRAQIA